MARPRRYVAYEQGEPRPFVAPPCARCGTRLADAHGNPKWDVIGLLTFVCLGGCLRRKAARS